MDRMVLTRVAIDIAHLQGPMLYLLAETQADQDAQMVQIKAFSVPEIVAATTKTIPISIFPQALVDRQTACPLRLASRRNQRHIQRRAPQIGAQMAAVASLRGSQLQRVQSSNSSP